MRIPWIPVSAAVALVAFLQCGLLAIRHERQWFGYLIAGAGWSWIGFRERRRVDRRSHKLAVIRARHAPGAKPLRRPHGQ